MAVPNFLILCSNLFYLKPPNFHSFRSFFFVPTTLALITSLIILFYISSTSNLFIDHPHVQLTYSRIRASIHKKGSISTQSTEPTSSIPLDTRSNSSIVDFTNSVELLKVPHLAKRKRNQEAAEFPKVSDGK